MERDNHILIDLETLGLQQDAAIIAIGAVRFDPRTGQLMDKFHANILWDTALRYGKAEPNTVAWWQGQSGAAKDALLDPEQRDIDTVFDEFIEWMGADPVVWGNGACFDLGKLEHLCESSGRPHPWFYRDTRDVRTIDQLGRELLGYGAADQTFVGVKHHPVDDAMNTATYVIQVYQQLLTATQAQKLKNG